MKNGEINFEFKEDKLIWKDKKRITVFALPWSFTTYIVTENRLIVKKGIIKTSEDETRLYRIIDLQGTQSFIEKINKTGTIIIHSDDASTPTVEIQHIKNYAKVKEMISQLVEESRKKNNVKTSEFVH